MTGYHLVAPVLRRPCKTMPANLIEVRGEVRPNGTLALEEKVNLPPGRVCVTIQPLVPPPTDDPFWQRMQGIWDDQKARGHVPRTKEQIDAEIRDLRDAAEEELRATEQLHEQ